LEALSRPSSIDRSRDEEDDDVGEMRELGAAASCRQSML
jgi:hypothetical protein